MHISATAIHGMLVLTATVVLCATARGEAVEPLSTGFQNVFTIDGPVRTDSGGDLVTDAAGNIFLAGSHGGLDLDKDGVVDIVALDADQMFMKLRYRGPDQEADITWVRSPSAPGMEQSAKVAPDREGGLVGIGRFRDLLTFDDGSTLGGGGGNDSFVVRYDSEGELNWSRLFGGPGQDALFDIDTDLAGNAYIVGMGADSFELDDDGASFAAPAGRTANIIFSYDSSGDVRWLHALPAGTFPLFVAVSPANELLIAGEFDGSADFDGDQRIDLRASQGRNGFVARFSLDGNLLGAWSTGGGGAGKPAFAADGDVFLGGMLSSPSKSRYGAADFDRDGRVDLAITGGGPTGAWVARYGIDGTMRWLRSYAVERMTDLQASGNKIVMTGAYHGVRDLDQDGTLEPSDRTVDPSLETELTILVLTDKGQPELVWAAPGPGNDVASAAAFSQISPTLFVTGYIQLTADFSLVGKSGAGWRNCEALGDFFFAQYGLDSGKPGMRELKTH